MRKTKIEEMRKTKIMVEVLRNKRGKWYWRLKSNANGRILAHSEDYSRKQSCEKTAWGVAYDLKVICIYA